MDRTQLITIAITAVISVVAKEMVTWLISAIKSAAAFVTFRDKFKAFFNKRNRDILSDVFAIIFFVGVLVNFASSNGTASRLEVLIAIGSVIAILICIFSLLINIAKWSIEREKNRPQ